MAENLPVHIVCFGILWLSIKRFLDKLREINGRSVNGKDESC